MRNCPHGKKRKNCFLNKKISKWEDWASGTACGQMIVCENSNAVRSACHGVSTDAVDDSGKTVLSICSRKNSYKTWPVVFDCLFALKLFTKNILICPVLGLMDKFKLPATLIWALQVPIQVLNSTPPGSHHGTNDATLPLSTPSASTSALSLTSEVKEAQVLRNDLLCTFLGTELDSAGEEDVPPPPYHR